MNQALQQTKMMMNQLRMVQNPQYALMQMIQQNPQLQQVLNIIKMSGGDAQSTFYAMAKQAGVDPQMILNALK